MLSRPSYATAVVVVVIGRNEGERLRICLQSVIGHASVVVYVDSGSTDGSVSLAVNLGATVIELDMTVPFTAARARNTGWREATKLNPSARWVQFVDGDCEIQPEWWLAAICHLENNNNVAVVCGRRRERYPRASIYNRLCDQEWDTAIGRSLACGGDAMMSVDALAGVGGYRDQLIAGEEPELCVRLRSNHYQIWRLDIEMAMHDAAMTRFEQWWKRSQRAGHAYAEGYYLHGRPPEYHWRRETLRSLFWAVIVPTLGAIGFAIVSPDHYLIWLISILAIYGMQLTKLIIKSQGDPLFRIIRGILLLIGKFSEAVGIFQFMFRKIFRQQFSLIEYK